MRPQPHAGQSFRSLSALSCLLTGTDPDGADTPSRSRHDASFFRRSRFDRKPYCRMRTKPLGQNVQQKAADKLSCRKRHRPLSGCRPRNPCTRNLTHAVFNRQQTPVGDRDPMCVAGQILQDLFRPTERRLWQRPPISSVSLCGIVPRTQTDLESSAISPWNVSLPSSKAFRR